MPCNLHHPELLKESQVSVIKGPRQDCTWVAPFIQQMGGEVEKTMQGNTEMPRPGKGRNINNTHITLSPLLRFYILISHSLKLFSTYCFKHWAKFFQVLSFSFFLPGISPFFFLKYILLVMLLQLSHFFSPFYPPPPCSPFPTSIPPL